MRPLGSNIIVRDIWRIWSLYLSFSWESHNIAFGVDKALNMLTGKQVRCTTFGMAMTVNEDAILKYRATALTMLLHMVNFSLGPGNLGATNHAFPLITEINDLAFKYSEGTLRVFSPNPPKDGV